MAAIYDEDELALEAVGFARTLLADAVEDIVDETDHLVEYEAFDDEEDEVPQVARAQVSLKSQILRAFVDGANGGKLFEALCTICPQAPSKAQANDSDDETRLADESSPASASGDFGEKGEGVDAIEERFAVKAARPPVDDSDWDDVLSVDSEDSFEERNAAEDALLTMQAALRTVSGAADWALADASHVAFEADVTMDGFESSEGEVEVGDEADDTGAFWVNDYVCGMVDTALENLADGLAGPASVSTCVAEAASIDAGPSTASLEACDRRSFARSLHPGLARPKSVVIARPLARGMPQRAMRLASPAVEVDWPALHRAVLSPAESVVAHAASSVAALDDVEEAQIDLKTSAANEGPEEHLLDDLLESLQPQGSLAASPEAAEPAEPEPTETETFESLLAEISESPDTHAAPKSAGQVPEPSDDEESKEEDELLRSLLAPTPRDATPATASAPASEPRSLHTSRTKRLVIGAVVRAAAPQTPAAEPAARSPTRSAALAQGSTLKLARSLRGAKKGLGGTSAMFRMDAADDPATGMQAARESSLTRGYEALGCRDFHHMDAVPAVAHRAQSRGGLARMGSSSSVAVAGGPSPFRSAGASAMALDLDSPGQSRFAQGGLAADVSQSLRWPTKANEFGRQLPSLSGHTAGSMAWTRRSASIGRF